MPLCKCRTAGDAAVRGECDGCGWSAGVRPRAGGEAEPQGLLAGACHLQRGMSCHATYLHSLPHMQILIVIVIVIVIIVIIIIIIIIIALSSSCKSCPSICAKEMHIFKEVYLFMQLTPAAYPHMQVLLTNTCKRDVCLQRGPSFHATCCHCLSSPADLAHQHLQKTCTLH